MLLRVCSDLHIEFLDWTYQGVNPISKFERCIPPHKDDHKSTLILAGDIATGSKKRCPIEFEFDEFDELCARFKYVVYINGNHEFYGGKIFKTSRKQRELSEKIDNLYFLNNQVIELDGKRILGSTLWTEIPPHLEFDISQRMNDYSRIVFDGDELSMMYAETRPNYRKLRVADTVKLHRGSVEFLKKNIKAGDIVVSHHSPSFLSVDKRFTLNKQDQDSNYAYHNRLDELIFEKNPKLWIHGHTHVSLDYDINNTKVVCNPRGYQGHGYRPENGTYNDFLFLEV